MKIRENVFNLGKQTEDSVSPEVIYFSKESSEGDQSIISDENSFRDNGWKDDNQYGTNNPFENFEKIRNASQKYSFVVDWQIPENF
jgi:hypothetical protein